MAYPLHRAEELVESLEHKIERAGTNVFFGPVKACAHGDEYRSVRADTTRVDWARVRSIAFKDGWKAFGNDGLIYDLVDRNFVVIEPNY
ncbi:hypothetical protein [Nibricoccus sp. IMCC34717]|uniref:hypothetical protein n=1 Tax=Nibricoccus sp. IMCC34717 TaxID=3034021 RepID=UPI00384D1A0F